MLRRTNDVGHVRSPRDRGRRQGGRAPLPRFCGAMKPDSLGGELARCHWPLDTWTYATHQAANVRLIK
jgi:hypothetical protein